MEINRTTLGIAAGVAGSLFLGYCIYFDFKRRKDPEYKKKVHDRRRKQKKTRSSNKVELPNLNDHEAVQRFFLQEIQLGEELIQSGHTELAVEHLANAIYVCGQPAQLLQILQNSLPAQVFTSLIQRMRQVRSPDADSERLSTVEPAKLSEDLTDDLE